MTQLLYSIKNWIIIFCVSKGLISEKKAPQHCTVYSTQKVSTAGCDVLKCGEVSTILRKSNFDIICYKKQDRTTRRGGGRGTLKMLFTQLWFFSTERRKLLQDTWSAGRDIRIMLRKSSFVKICHFCTCNCCLASSFSLRLMTKKNLDLLHDNGLSNKNKKPMGLALCLVTKTTSVGILSCMTNKCIK